MKKHKVNNKQKSPNDHNRATDGIKQMYHNLKVSIESGKAITASCFNEPSEYMRLLNVYEKKDGQEDGSWMQVYYWNNDDEGKNKGEWLVVRFKVGTDKWTSYATPMETSMMLVAKTLHSIMTDEKGVMKNKSDHEWDWRILNMLSGKSTCRALVPKETIEEMIEQ